jgi:hypothetical protein
MNQVLFANDTRALNDGYRADLIRQLDAQGFSPVRLGLFENGHPNLRDIMALAKPGRTGAVASNLRSNLVALVCVWRRGLVILNGMGRQRQRATLRRILRLGFSANRFKQIAVQNRADYRYFRRYLPEDARARLHWVPGSGGSARDFGNASGLIAVQRADKLPLVADALKQALSLMPASTLTLVGCTADDLNAAPSMAQERVKCVGRVPQDALLKDGDIFVQPRGYGEGFPHSLADALVSGMPALIHRRDLSQYGLRVLGADVQPVKSLVSSHISVDPEVTEWVAVHPTAALQSALDLGTITAHYLTLRAASDNPQRV